MKRRSANLGTVAAAALLLVVFPAAMEAQATGATAAAMNVQAAAISKKSELPPAGARRRAMKLYLAASKLYLDGQFEKALNDYQQAAKLDPTNADYSAAAEVARSHAVAALIQTEAKDRFAGNASGALEALERARALDPTNPEVAQHLYELGGDAVRGEPKGLYQQAGEGLAGAPTLDIVARQQSFHLRTDARQLVRDVFKAYGVTALVDDSVHDVPVRLDIDNVDFADAARAASLVTNSFYVPVDAHRVLVALDNRENREKFTREELETISLPGLTSEELTETSNLARNVFGIQQVATNANTNTLTLRAAPSDLAAFNANIHDLLQGSDQVVLDMRIIQVAHSSTFNSGVQPPQSFSAINVYSEEQSILNANQSLVQEIISSGLASPDDPLAILGILLASGEVSSSLFSGGLALFGGGLTESAISPGGPATLNFNLNTSDTRVLDNVQLRLGDGEAGTIKEGTKYPIQTARYSQPSLPNIAGLTGAGASGSLSSLVSSLSSAVPSIPMIQYEDLGLTLKVTPKVLRDDDVALTVDLSITALSGSTLDGNPILNNQAYSGVVTMRKGETGELVSQLNRSESLAVSGTPGLSEIPGMNNITDKSNQKSYATLLIVITPHVVRATQPAGHTAPMIVEKSAMTQ